MAIKRNSSDISVEDGSVVISGWVQDVRNMGGISFLTLRDRFGTIQVWQNAFIAQTFHGSTVNCCFPCRLLSFPESKNIKAVAFFSI